MLILADSEDDAAKASRDGVAVKLDHVCLCVHYDGSAVAVDVFRRAVEDQSAFPLYHKLKFLQLEITLLDVWAGVWQRFQLALFNSCLRFQVCLPVISRETYPNTYEIMSKRPSTLHPQCNQPMSTQNLCKGLAMYLNPWTCEEGVDKGQFETMNSFLFTCVLLPHITSNFTRPTHYHPTDTVT